MNDRLAAPAEFRAALSTPAAPGLFLNYAIFLPNGIWSANRLRAVAFQGQDSVSEPFEFQLELYDETGTPDARPDFDALVGRPVTVGLQYPADAPTVELAARFDRAVRGGAAGGLSLFNGIITSMSMETLRIYRLTIKPALWKLGLTNAYCVHRQRNVRDAIADLLDRHRIAYSMDAVSGDDNPALVRIQDWLQAGETDLDFIRRLMGKAHLYYYFAHSGNSHRLVFANRPAYPPAVPDGRPLRYAYTAVNELGLVQTDVVVQYAYQQSLVSSSVRGVFTRQEAAWEEDAVAQFQSFEAHDRAVPGELPFNRHKIYQYGCSTSEVRHFTDATASSMQASAAQLSGATHCASFRSGHQFGMVGRGYVGGQTEEIDPSLEGRRFVLTQVKHEAREDGSYKNEFQATDAQALVAPFSVQETQQGAVLAKVVAHRDKPPEDWRYYTADYFEPGITKLSDSESAPPELSAVGVFVRFSTDGEGGAPVWIKLSASMQTVPEIGVTVTVVRAQDESELPEIQSIVQSNGSMVIMPSGWTANTHVGSNYSTSYGDGKSIRFGRKSAADLDRAVKIVSVPYDSGLYGNTSYGQGASYSFSTAESTATRASDLDELYGPYGGAADLLNASESFGSSYSRQYANVTSGFSHIGTSYNNSTVTLSESISNTTTQKSTSTVGTSTSTSTIGSTTSTDAIGSQTSTQAIGSTMSTQAIGMSTSIAAIGMQNGVNTTGMSNQASVTGMSTAASVTGMSVSAGATGMRVSAEATGMSVSSSVLGMSVSDSTTGFAADDSTVGTSNKLSMVGVSANVNVTVISNDANIVGQTNKCEMAALETLVKNLAAGVNLDCSPAAIRTKMSGPDIDMPAIKLYM
jgi:type VI secretion system secreted protein VgrG